jgi:hypothetical protein
MMPVEKHQDLVEIKACISLFANSTCNSLHVHAQTNPVNSSTTFYLCFYGNHHQLKAAISDSAAAAERNIIFLNIAKDLGLKGRCPVQ